MSASTARRLATASSLTLALALASPAAAFAQSQEDGERGRSEQARQDKADEKADGGSSASSSSGSAGSGSAGGSGTTTQGKSRTGKSSTGKGSSGGAGTAEAKGAKDGDPAGNNGTVKIDDAPFDDTPGNEPHVGCTFQIDFFGFDAGDRADVTLTGHAPTGGGLLWSATDRLVSTDAAGGGQDVDESITLTIGDLDLTGATPHPKQGYHVKLAADVTDAPGGAKQKVFWIKCAPAVTTTPPATGTGGGGGTTTTTTTTTPTTAGGGGTTTATEVLGARSVERSAPELTLGAGTTTLTGTTVEAATGAGTVAARGAVRPSVLPFTGVEGLGYLLAVGASAVGVGTVAHRLGRRRAAEA